MALPGIHRSLFTEKVAQDWYGSSVTLAGEISKFYLDIKPY